MKAAITLYFSRICKTYFHTFFKRHYKPQIFSLRSLEVNFGLFYAMAIRLKNLDNIVLTQIQN